MQRLIRLCLVIITSKLAMSLASFAVADLVTYEWHMTLIMQADTNIRFFSLQMYLLGNICTERGF